MTEAGEIPREELFAAARGAAANAHAPYSKFHVGAAIAAGGSIFTGCNVENASYGLTICAERNAVAAAVAGGAKSIEAIAIYTDTEALTPPCGACRQVLAEFNPGMTVILAGRGDRTATHSLEDLLPHGFRFTPKDSK